MLTLPKILDNPLFVNWPYGLIAFDSNNQVVALSKSAQETLGWTQTDVYGKHAHDFLCVLTRNYIHDFDDCMFNRVDFSSDERTALWQKKDGTFISVDFHFLEIKEMEANHVIAFKDNTHRTYNFEEFSKFSEFVEQSPSPFIEFDETGQILYCNTAMSVLMDEHEFDQYGQANILPKDIAKICESIFHDTETTQRFTCESETNNYYYSWHFQLFTTDHQNTILAYGFDITEQKQAQISVEQQKQQSRKELFAKMVHELRTPLNAIIGFSNLLASRLEHKLTEDELERLNLIKNAGLQLADMVTDTLDFNKIESGKMTLEISEFAVAEVGESIHEQMQTLAVQKKLDYQFKSFTDATICSDRNKVRQIFTNLISNAIKYTPEGSVNVLVSETLDEDIGSCIHIVVLDTGIGIPEDKLPTLFDSYEQVESEATRSIQGTGLGLALVKDLIQLLGGKINVTSELNSGSSFEVLLPYSTSFASRSTLPVN